MKIRPVGTELTRADRHDEARRFSRLHAKAPKDDHIIILPWKLRMDKDGQITAARASHEKPFPVTCIKKSQ
jgi:hypothetical protein